MHAPARLIKAAVLGAVLLGLSACDQSHPVSSDADRVAAAIPSPPGENAAKIDDEVDEAYRYAPLSTKPDSLTKRVFKAAFGQPSPIRSNPNNNPEYDDAFFPGYAVQIEAAELIALDGGVLALVSKVSYMNCPHGAGGHLLAHYVRQRAKGFEVLARPKSAYETQSCNEISAWRVRRDIGKYPMIQIESDDAHQLVRRWAIDLISLRPDGPRYAVEKIPIRTAYYSPKEYDLNGYDGRPYCETRGDVQPEKGREAFRIIYSGHARATLHYRLTNGSYETRDTLRDSDMRCPDAPIN